MTLQHTFSKKVEIPEGLQEHYKETSDGKWRLDIAGIEKPTIWEDIEAIKEAHRKEKEDHASAKGTIKEIKAERDQALSDIEVLKKDGKGLNKEEAIAFAKAQRDVEDLTTKLNETTEKYQAQSKQIESNTIQAHLRKVLTPLVNEHAIEDAINLYSDKFSLVDGNQVLTNANNDGNVGLTAEKLFEGVVAKKPHWAKESVGGGANSSQRQGAQQTQGGSFVDKLTFN